MKFFLIELLLSLEWIKDLGQFTMTENFSLAYKVVSVLKMCSDYKFYPVILKESNLRCQSASLSMHYS